MKYNNQVAAISDFVRTLGGGIGISLVTTFLARQVQVQQYNLSAHATRFDSGFRSLVSHAVDSMIHHGSGPVLARQQAYTQVMRTVQAQATTLAFTNTFWLMAIIVFCLAPLPLLLSKPKLGPSA